MTLIHITIMKIASQYSLSNINLDIIQLGLTFIDREIASHHSLSNINRTYFLLLSNFNSSLKVKNSALKEFDQVL